MEEQGFGFVVVEALVRYHKAAFFDDELTLRTKLAGASKASLRFEYQLVRDGEVISTGYTRHACVQLPGGRLIRTPEQLLRLARDAS
jgi:acyl-CoA thioester hydrolase